MKINIAHYSFRIASLSFLLILNGCQFDILDKKDEPMPTAEDTIIKSEKADEVQAISQAEEKQASSIIPQKSKIRSAPRRPEPKEEFDFEEEEELIAEENTYTVKKGDSLWGIANAHNITINELLNLNNLTARSVIHSGMVLRLPEVEETKESFYTVRKGDTLGKISKRFSIPVNAIREANGIRGDLIHINQQLILPGADYKLVEQDEIVTKAGVYKVKQGDSLSKIASKTGVSVSNLMDWNNIHDKNKIIAGQELVLRSDLRKPKQNFNPVQEESKVEEAVIKNHESVDLGAQIVEEESPEGGAAISDVDEDEDLDMLDDDIIFSSKSPEDLIFEELGEEDEEESELDLAD